ncbi:hypothetical protein ACJRPK_06485 [Aquimarina sp. 2-A2]|uniref:hypothetical protein n=1 Tax=Aquimarina sp. 2-A2 TaxID=3382644 RepID=UPI00387EF078
MKRFLKAGLIILSIVIVLFLLATWYKYEFSMEIADAYQVNSPYLESKLLIATQGSDFKNAIVDGVVNHFKGDTIFIDIMDISGLNKVKPEDYDAILILHTWENWKPPFVVKRFVENTTDQHDKMLVLTTSGQGSYTIKQVNTLYNLEEIDALVGESNVKNVKSFVKAINVRLQELLTGEN